MRKKIINLTIVIMLLISTIPLNAFAAGFEDVSGSSYYAAAVEWTAEKGITTGVSATKFAPNDPCLRAQVVTFLWRYAGSPEPEKTDNIPFTDVENSYYTKAVLWAVEKGITTGTSDTTFSPEAVCTRGQVVTFLYRFANSPETQFVNCFTDVHEGEYCSLSVTWAVDKCITNGTSSTQFSPKNDCTRAHVVTFLHRYEQNVVEPAWDGVPLLEMAGQNLEEIEVLTRLGQELPTIIEPWLGEDNYQDNDPARLEESGQAVYAWAQKLKAAGIIRNCTYNSTGHTVGFFLPTGIAYVYVPDIRGTYSGAVKDYYAAQAFDELPVVHKVSTWEQNAIASVILKYNVTRGSGGSAEYIDSKLDEYDSSINGYQTVSSLRTRLQSLDGKNGRVILWRGHGYVYTDEDGTEVAAFCMRDKTWKSDRDSNPTDYVVNGNQHPVAVDGTSLMGNLLETSVTARFFEKYLPQVSGGLFFSGACFTGADKKSTEDGNSYMGNVVTDKGFDCYVAPNGSVANIFSDGCMSLISAHLCEFDENDPFHRRKTLLTAITETVNVIGTCDENGVSFECTSNDKGAGADFRLLPAWEEEYEKIITKTVPSYGSVVQLADLDADNVPELLFGSIPGSGVFSLVGSAYTFKNNKAVELKVKEDNVFLCYNGLTAYKKDNTYRIEGTYTLRAGAGNYSNCISTYSVNNSGAEMQTVFTHAVTSSITSGTSTDTYYKGNEKLASEQAYNNEIKSWRKGWSEVEKYPNVTEVWRKKPSSKEIRAFIKSYNEA